MGASSSVPRPGTEAGLASCSPPALSMRTPLAVPLAEQPSQRSPRDDAQPDGAQHQETTGCIASAASAGCTTLASTAGCTTLASTAAPSGSLEGGLGGSRPGDICLGASFLSVVAPAPQGNMLDDEQVVVCANILLYAALTCPAVMGLWVTDLQTIRVRMMDAAESTEESSQARELRDWMLRGNTTIYVVTCVDEHFRVQTFGGGHWTCLVFEVLPTRCNVQIYDPLGEEFVSIQDRSRGSLGYTAEAVAEWLCWIKYNRVPRAATQVSTVRVRSRDLQQPGSLDCGLHVALFVMKDAASRNPTSVELPAQMRNLRTCAISAQQLRSWLVDYAEGFDSKACGGPLEKERATKALEALCRSVDNVRCSNDKCAYYCTDRCTDRCAVQ